MRVDGVHITKHSQIEGKLDVVNVVEDIFSCLCFLLLVRGPSIVKFLNFLKAENQQWVALSVKRNILKILSVELDLIHT